jgi:carbon storage regulator
LPLLNSYSFGPFQTWQFACRFIVSMLHYPKLPINPWMKREVGMLVLTRRVNESVVINGNITVTLLGIEGDKVKLGIAAPREVSIFRKELYDGIQAQEKLQDKLVEGSEPDTFKALRDLLISQAPPEEDKDSPARPDDPNPKK